ncbi:hypothetical protein INR49_011020 [Caranx melampygus]|nr:hypothetical protein INR49_011020 [Caranx melampygus]
MGSASSFSTNGDAFFLLPKPRGIVVLQRGEGSGGEEAALVGSLTTSLEVTVMVRPSSVRALTVHPHNAWRDGERENGQATLDVYC